MERNLTRRDLLKSSLALGVASATGISPVRALAASDKLNLAVIGIGGRGRTNLDALAKQNIVALCDVDDERAGNAYEKFPKAKRFKDFRVMLDKLESSIDGVVVSTPDHTHFHAAHRALSMNKHLYLEKPMAHTVWEVRTLTELAAENGVATQLGVQRHTYDNVHRVVELIQAGAIGDVEEVHCWVDGDRGMPGVPTEYPPVPDHLDWDLWLGPAHEAPYHPDIAPYGWRFWWDYGTGETGNWGCHILDIPFWALALRYPERVGGAGPDVHPKTTPKSMTTWFDFPATNDRPAVRLHWSHAANGPEILRQHELSADGNNTLFVGSEGMLLCGFKKRRLLPEKKFAGFDLPEKSIPDSPGFHEEWIHACQGGPKPTCAFDYSGPLTETVLLGNVAYRVQDEFAWNAKRLKAKNNSAAQDFIRTPFRKGWEM